MEGLREKMLDIDALCDKGKLMSIVVRTNLVPVNSNAGN